jgi:hypothetical protein
LSATFGSSGDTTVSHFEYRDRFNSVNTNWFSGDCDLRGIPHTIKVERKGNELIVHIALTERPSWGRTGVILASEGWQDIGYGLKMQLTIASTNVILQNERIKLIQKPGVLNRLRGKKIPMLEDKS